MIHHLFANRSNAGDWLSAKGIQSLLKRPVIEHLCDEPFVDATIAELSQAGPADFILIGGGGLFMDYFIPFWEKFKAISSKVPFGIWGAGYCDLKRENSRPPAALLREIIGRSRFCYVRDELTRKHLGIPALPAPVPCPSIEILQPTAEKGNGLLHVDNLTTAGEDVYETMDRLCREFAERTGRPYRKTNNRHEGTEASLKSVLRYYEKSEFVVSSALHGCVIALGVGRKVLAVSGDRKIEAFMDAMGLLEWVCDIEELDEFSSRLERLREQKIPEERIRFARAANHLVAGQILREIENARKQTGSPC